MHRNAWLILLLLLGARSAGWSQNLVDSEQPFLPGVWAGQAAWGDYDGDGDLDLALVGETSQAGKPERIAQVLRNDQGLLFEDPDQTPRLVGVYFGDVAWADYDSDGDLDLAIAGWDANGDESLRLYRNEAGGTGGRQLTWDAAQVDPVTTISTLKGVRYARLAWGDYDGDGDPDLIVIGMDANGSSLTRIYRNERALLQVDQVNSEAVVNVHNGDVAWADYDGDGDLDLAICGQSVAPKSGVVIVTEFYRNDPEGTLTLDDNTRLTSTDGRGTILLRGGSLAWGDYDDDGLPDLAVSGRDNVWNAQLLLYRNRPAGVLSQDASYALNTTRRIAGELAWVDYDNDGDLDLAASGRSILSDYKTLVFSNDQDRLSSSPAEDLPGLAGGAAVWGDYDGDGRVDLLATGVDATGQRRTLLYNNSTPSADQAPSPPSRLNPVKVTAGRALFSWAAGTDPETANLTYNLRIGTDSTGAGQDEILSGALPAGSGNVGSKTTKVLQRFLKPDTYFWSVQAVDGALARSAWSQQDKLVVQQFVSSEQRLRPLKLAAMAWGDYDGDGDPDLATMGENRSGEAQSVFYENRSGTLTAVSQAGIASLRNGGLAWGDYDRDGDLDLVITGEDTFGNRATILYRTETDTDGKSFVEAGRFKPLSSSSVAWGDLDRDGALDLALMGLSDDSEGGVQKSAALVFLNDGKGGFDDSRFELVGIRDGALAWGDFDGDGDLDLAATGSTDADTPDLRVYRNDWPDSLADAQLGLRGVLSSALAWGDFDGDGDLDLAAAGKSGAGQAETTLYENRGAGQLVEVSGTELPGIWGGDLVWGDYDSDQDLDLILAGNDGQKPILQVYRNTGDPAAPLTQDATLVVLEAEGVDVGGVSLADIDGDGDLDLISLGSDAAAAPTAWANDNLAAQQGLANRPPEAPASAAAADSADVVLLGWQQASDDGSPPPASLTYNLRVGTAAGSDDVLSGNSPLGIGNAGHSLLYRLRGLASGTYYWSVQTVDAGLARSAWTSPRSFVIDTIPPRLAQLSLSRRQAGIGQSVSLALSFADEHAGVDPQVEPAVEAVIDGRRLAFTRLQYTGATWSGELAIGADVPSGPAAISVRGLVDRKANPMAAYDSTNAFVVDTELPTVIGQSPAAGGVAVSPETGEVSIAFSEPLDPATVTAANFKIELEGDYLGYLTDPVYDDQARTVQLLPASALLPGSRYTVEVSAAIQDLAGNRPANAFSWAFDTQIPRLVETTPPDSAAGAMAGNDRLLAVFSGPLVDSLLSVSGMVQVQRENEGQALRSAVFDRDSNTLSLELEKGLRPGSRYQVVLSGRLAGPLRLAEGDFRWQFSTAVPDTVRVSPSAGDAAVPAAGVAAIEVEFDQAVDAEVVRGPGGVRLMHSGVDEEITGLSYDAEARLLRFEPPEGLHAGTGYQVIVAAAAGGPLRQGDYTWRFSTAVPQLVETAPDSGAAGVAVDLEEVVIRFDPPLDPNQATAANFGLFRSGEAVSLALRTGDPVLRGEGQYGLAPAGGWQVGTTYRVEIAPGVNGPLGTGQSISWQFATAVPETTRVSPEAGDNRVSAGATGIEVGFDQAVDVEVLRAKGGVRLLENGEDVEIGSVAYEPDTRVVRLTPAAGFHAGTSYQVVLASGIGGPLRQGEYSWRFSTAVPQLAEVAPASGAAGVGVDLVEVEVRFAPPLDPAQVVPANFRLRREGEEIPLRAGDPVVRGAGQYGLAPAGGWQVGSTYQVEIAPGVSGPMGDRQGVSWQFATAVPETARVSPAAGDTRAPVETASIEVEFDQAVDVEALRAHGGVRLLESGEEAGIGSVVYEPDTRVVRLTPTAGFRAGTSYQVVLASGLGGPLRQGEYSWRFSTAVPQLAGVAPDSGATGVGVDLREVEVRFDPPLDPAQVTPANFGLQREGKAIQLRSGDPVVRGAGKYGLAPAGGWQVGSTYQVAIAPGVSGPLGDRRGVSWQFATAVPETARVSPAAGDTRAPVETASIEVEFDQAVDAEVLRADRGVRLLESAEEVEISGLAYDPDTRVVRLAPAAGFHAGTPYQVVLASGIGGPLRQGDYTWRFSTRIPTPLRTEPPDQAAVAAGVRRVQVVFSSPIDTALITPANFGLSRAGAPVSLDDREFLYDPATHALSFPAVDLASGSAYEAVVSSRVSGVLGASLPDLRWSFRTALPAVVSTRPEAGAEGVSTSAPVIQVVFSGPVARQDEGGFQVRARPLADPDAPPELVAITGFGADSSGTAISFALRDGLRPSTEYEVVIDRRILGELAAAGYHWIFRTASRLTDPARGGTVAGANGMVELYFPPHALPQGSGEVVIRPVANPGVGKVVVQEPGLSQAGWAYEIIAGAGVLRRPATLTVRWVAEELGARDPSRLSVFRFETAGWQRVGGIPDPALRQVRTAVDSLGTYALFEDLRTPVGRPTVEQLDCQPRAFAPAGGTLDAQTAVSFRLSGPADVTVRVYNTSGRLERVIQRGEPMAPGRVALVWDGRDEDRKVVASGLYIVVVTAGSSQAEKVVAVVR